MGNTVFSRTGKTCSAPYGLLFNWLDCVLNLEFPRNLSSPNSALITSITAGILKPNPQWGPVSPVLQVVVTRTGNKSLRLQKGQQCNSSEPDPSSPDTIETVRRDYARSDSGQGRGTSCEAEGKGQGTLTAPVLTTLWDSTSTETSRLTYWPHLFPFFPFLFP